MVSATIQQAQERARRIGLVEYALKEIKEKNLILDDNSFVINICDKFNISGRTAKEYIRIAQARFKNDRPAIQER